MSQPTPTPADYILRNGALLTIDPARRLLNPGSLVIQGQHILALGPTAEIDAAYSATQTIDCTDHIIMPGLINAHTHLPMSLLRGLADDLRLDVWLHGYILPVEREFVNPEFCFLGTLLSCAEMLRGGTTCFADMYYHEEEVAWAAVQAGMRGHLRRNDPKVPHAQTPPPTKRACATAATCSSTGAATSSSSPPPPPTPSTCARPTSWRETTALARQYDAPLLIHVSETQD